MLEEKISVSGNDVGTFYEYWKYITDCFITINFCAEKENLHPLNNMPMWAAGSSASLTSYVKRVLEEHFRMNIVYANF